MIILAILIIYSIQLLFQDSAGFDWSLTKWWPLIVIAGLLVAAIIYLLSTARKETNRLQTEKGKALSELIDSRDKQIKDGKERELDWATKYALLEKSLDAITVEYKALASINIRELLNFSEMIIERKMIEQELKMTNDELDSVRLELLRLKGSKK